jgi:glycosyltransferase involved in cell wall biosynthesis
MLLAENCTAFSHGIIIPNGLNPNNYQILPPKGSFRKSHPETSLKKLILFLGRISFKKGLDILIPAFIRLSMKHPDYNLVVSGPDNEGIVERIIFELQQAGLPTEGPNSRITITGMISGDEKLAALNDADVFVLPSYSENFGIAVIEAMICGLPVIISDKVNIWREVVTDKAGIAGPCDINWFADAIESLLEQPEKRHEMGLAGIASVKKRYDWKNIAIQLENAYFDIIEKHKKRLAGNVI